MTHIVCLSSASGHTSDALVSFAKNCEMNYTAEIHSLSSPLNEIEKIFAKSFNSEWKLYLSPNPTKLATGCTIEVISLAKQYNCAHVVLVSSILLNVDYEGYHRSASLASTKFNIHKTSLAQINRGLFTQNYIDMETHIQNSKIPFTILRCSPLQQNFMNIIEELLSSTTSAGIAKLNLPIGIGHVSFIDARDVAHVAKKCLLQSQLHNGQTYVLTGSESLTGVEIARRAASGLNLPVCFENTSDRTRSYMLVFATPDASKVKHDFSNKIQSRDVLDFVKSVEELFVLANSDLLNIRSRDVQFITGKNPRTLTNFFAEQRNTFESAKKCNNQVYSSFIPKIMSTEQHFVGSYGGGLGRFIPMAKM